VHTYRWRTGSDVQQNFDEDSINHNKANVPHFDELYSVYLCNGQSLDGNMYNYHTGKK